MTKLLRAIILLVTTVSLLCGCSTISAIYPYPDRIQPIIESVADRDQIDSDGLFRRELRSNDEVLFRLERGRLAQIQGDHDLSLREFRQVIEALDIEEEKAVISVTDGLAEVAAIAVNDNAMPYRLRAHERVMVHHFQALNYLATDQLEAALVEVRRADSYQQTLVEAEDDPFASVQRAATENGIDYADLLDRLDDPLASMDWVASAPEHGFLNAYTYYLSAIIYELAGQLNDAYIDYKKALAIGGPSQVLVADVLRLGRRLGMADDITSMFPNLSPGYESFAASDSEGQLICLYEDGLIPAKQEFRLVIPILADPEHYVPIAVPFYGAPVAIGLPLGIATQEQSLGRTERLCSIYPLAVTGLKEEMPSILVRQLLRAVGKSAAMTETKRRFGGTAFILAQLLGFASERADLRSWNTLPDTVQVMRVPIPAGPQTLILDHPAIDVPHEIDIDVPAGSRCLLHVIRTRNTLQSHIIVVDR